MLNDIAPRLMVDKLDRPSQLSRARQQVTGVEYALIATSVVVAVVSALLTINQLPL